MNILFILGAGASKAAGGPLMKDFYGAADLLYRNNHEGISDLRPEFECVIDSLRELSATHEKAQLELQNIEDIFSAIEMGSMLKKFGGLSEEEIERLRESIKALIVGTLESSILFKMTRGTIIPPSPFEAFINALTDISKKAPPTNKPKYSFITFNYDLTLDVALTSSGLMKPDYCLNPENYDLQSTPLLKLHGSLNWGYCQKCKEIDPRYVSDFHFRDLATTHHWPISYKTLFRTPHHCSHTLERMPFLVPPTWNKTSRNKNIVSVWRKAASALAEAEIIIIIGYSLPMTDYFFRYLYALGSASRTPLQGFVVINPDSGAVSRLENLTGAGVRQGFHRIEKEFVQAIEDIKSYLGRFH